MPAGIVNESFAQDVEMETLKDSDIPRSTSNSSNESSSTLESGKDPPLQTNDDTIGSGASFVLKAYDESDMSPLPFQNSPTPNFRPNQNRTTFLQGPSISSPYLRNGNNIIVREHTPENSLYNMDAICEMTGDDKKKLFKKNMMLIYSSIYGILLTTTGAIIYVNHQSPETRHISELFSTCIAIVGMAWLIFLHVDLNRYKKQIYKKIIVGTEQMDKISTITDFNLAATFIDNETPPYRFLRGRHSGSFYLKLGLAAFCFGHLLNEGILLGQEIINFVQEDRYELGCGDTSSIVHHIIRPLYSFYQLFIVFKYSNIIIHRYKGIACISLMHIMATCLCFWFGTIVEDALEDYHHHLGQNITTSRSSSSNGSNHLTSDHAICSHLVNSSSCICSSTAILSVNNVQAIPYLYPFTIEFNILLAGVWFIVWHNIGKQNHKANPHHFQHKINTRNGIEEVTYQSNLVISADCHASNKGLFAGMFLLMTSIISVIIFFVAMNLKKYETVAISIHYFQEGTLTTLALIGVMLGYKQLSKLEYNHHPIHFLDDILLFVPLPFFFIQALLIVISEFQKHGVIRIILSVMTPVQVILQTPFIIDGLRRCSNSQNLRYKKPGREIVTFLIVCNLTMWIINTFEAKSVESHYAQDVLFGKFLWMFVSHTTLPLMLFYRFHSSACLADIWKAAYEKGE